MCGENCKDKEDLNLLCFKGRPQDGPWVRVTGPGFRSNYAGTWFWRLIPKACYMQFMSYWENYQLYDDKVYIKETDNELGERTTIEIIDSPDTFITLYERGARYRIIHNTNITREDNAIPKSFRKEDVQLCIGKSKRAIQGR